VGYYLFGEIHKRREGGERTRVSSRKKSEKEEHVIVKVLKR